MAIVVVQHKSASIAAATSLALTLTTNVTVGNLIIVAQSFFQGDSPTAPTDNSSPTPNTYDLAVSEVPPATGTPSQVQIYYAVANASQSLTVTAHNPSGNNIHLHVYEVSGLVNVLANVLDKIGTNTLSSASQTVSTSAATTQAAEFVLAIFADDNHVDTFSNPGAYLYPETSATAGDTTYTQGLITTSTGVQTSTITSSTSARFTNAIATFFGATVKHFLPLLGTGR